MAPPKPNVEDAGESVAAPDGARPVTRTAPTLADLPPVATDWCIDGLVALDEETCAVLPPLADGKPPRLLVYLHGIVPFTKTSVQKTRVQEIVLQTSARAGAAAIVPRGLRGIGPEGARDWWAWPTSPAAHAEHAEKLVAKWSSAKARLEAHVGIHFERTYLAGSSNGAYFLTALALRGDLPRFGFPVDGFGAMSGGASGGVPSSRARAFARPIYVGFGTRDEESRKNAGGLLRVAEEAGWPSRRAEHPFDHGAHAIYVDEAFAFWDALTLDGSR